MIGGILAAIFAGIGYAGWSIAWNKAKLATDKAELLAEKLKAERERRRIAEQQTEWYRSRFSHPVFRSAK